MFSIIELNGKNIIEVIRVRTSEEAHDMLGKYMAWKPDSEFSIMECA